MRTFSGLSSRIIFQKNLPLGSEILYLMSTYVRINLACKSKKVSNKNEDNSIVCFDKISISQENVPYIIHNNTTFQFL